MSKEFTDQQKIEGLVYITLTLAKTLKEVCEGLEDILNTVKYRAEKMDERLDNILGNGEE